ncbi:MAG: amidohydrolase family protein [Myxococcales bacterium]|nr:amidohydrolase family protein [Myxococcales bacterium]
MPDAPTLDAPTPSENATLLWSDQVVLGDHETGLRVVAAAVKVSGTRIVDVTECDRETFENTVFSGKKRDISGRLLTPAFVNAHTHLSMASFRGMGGAAIMRNNVIEDLYFTVETKVEDADVRAFARMGAYESLRAGVGVVWEHYYGGTELAGAFEDTGLAGFVAPTLQDLDGPGVDRLDHQWQATYDLLENTSLADKGVFPALGPHATDTVSGPLWRRIADAASKHDLSVHAHVSQSIEEYERAHERHGVSPAKWLASTGALDARFLLVHGVFLSESDLKILDPARHTLGFCPYSQLQFCFPADVQSWDEAGVPWLVATDCAASNDGMGPQKELRFVAGLRSVATSWSHQQEAFHKSGSLHDARELQARRQRTFDAWPVWADPDRLLARVWSIPGRLDPKMRSGVIAPGAWAHLLTWDVSHPSFWPGNDVLRTLAYAEPGDALDGMMVSGKWIGEPGTFRQSLLGDGAYEEARSEANARLKSLLARI